MKLAMDLPASGKSNRTLLIILALIASGFIGLGFYIYKTIESPAPQTELDKLTVPVNLETLPVEIKASGVVQPIQSVNISPKVSGRVAKLFVEQGMQVKKGQVLAIMDNLEIQAQGFQAQARVREAIANFKAAQVRIPGEISQAQARLAQTQARLKEAQDRLEQSKQRIPKDFDQAKAQVAAAKSRLALAQLRVKRNESLAKEGAITQDQFDAIVNEYVNAQAAVFEAEQKLKQLENTASPEISQLQNQIVQLQAIVGEAQIALEQRKRTASAEMAQLKAVVEQTQGQLEQIKIQFQDTVIRAPFDGIITQKYATEGAFVTPTTSASDTASATSASIVALARGLEIVAKVPEVDLRMLRFKQPVNIVADAYPNQVFQGQVIRIAPEAVVEQNVTSFEVTIALLTGQNKLLSRMNVDVTFLGQELSSALVVPTVAIVTQEGKTGVYVPDKENQDKPKFQPITIGLVVEDKTQVLSGLTPGERVFIDLPERPEKNDKKK